jgi:hypothetical protein
LKPKSSSWTVPGFPFCILNSTFSILLLSLIIACSPPSTPPSSQNDYTLTVRIERAQNGRVLVTGDAGVPDGAWVYVETIADPAGFAAPHAEAFPVRARAFSALTPFSATLDYKATAVLSPLLNPDLARTFAQLPERPGVMMRPAGESRELIAEAKSDFGAAKEHEDAKRQIAESLLKLLEPLRFDLDAIASEGEKDLSAWYKEFNKHRKDALAEGNLTYAPDLAADIEKICADLDAIFRLRLDALQGKPLEQEKIDKPAASARRLLDTAQKRLDSFKPKPM